MRVTCLNNCCELEIHPYLPRGNVCWSKLGKRRKAGIFGRDETTGKLLIVQSRGKLWGPPKGGIQPNETPEQAAVRELREETGLRISQESLANTTVTRLKTKTVYYHYSFSETAPVSVQNIPGNDANGIGWVHPQCIQELASTGRIELSAHMQKLLQRIE